MDDMEDGVVLEILADLPVFMTSSPVRVESSCYKQHVQKYSLRDVERRPVLCSFKRIEGGSAYQKQKILII